MEMQPSIPLVIFFTYIYVTVNKVINTENVAMAAQQWVCCTTALHMSRPTTGNTLSLHVISQTIFVRFGRLEFRQTFVKMSPNIKFHENPSGGCQRIYRRTDITELVGVLGPRGIQATEADKTKLPSNCPKSITVRTRSKMLTSCSGVGG
jgi:hypothetical protein